MKNQTKREPLVSDEFLASYTLMSDDWPDGPSGPVTPTEVRNIYEAAIDKQAELIQMAVDACTDPHKMSLAAKFLDAAKAEGFTPTPERM